MKKIIMVMTLVLFLLLGTACQKIEPVYEDFSEEDIFNISYLSIWNYYEEDFEGKHVRFAGKVEYVLGNKIIIREGLNGLFANVYLDFDKTRAYKLKNLSKGDYIIVNGKIKSKNFNRLSIKNVDIEMGYGKEAFEREREAYHELLEFDKMEYLSQTKVIDYMELIREPYKYKRDKFKIEVRITKTLKKGYIGEEGEYENEWFIDFKVPKDSPRIIEGDTVVFYGEFNDIKKVKKTILIDEVYIPELIGMYYEIIK